jgi:hypothetical protein
MHPKKMLKDDKKETPSGNSGSISIRTRYLILAIVFIVTGIGKLWLWYEGMVNDFGLCLGIGLCLGAVIMFWVAWRNKA